MTSHDRSIHDPLTGQHLTFTKTAADTHGTSLQAVVVLEPAGFVPRHLHLRQEENLRILTGTIRLRTGGATRLLSPGDTATIPRRRMHAIANGSTSDTSFVLEVRPARRIERTIRSTFLMGRALRPLARLRRPSAGSTNRPDPGAGAAPEDPSMVSPGGSIDTEGSSDMTHSDALKPASRATNRRASRLHVLKWLGVLPLIPAGPLLFFGLAWFVPGLFALGLAFVAAALLVWRAFAGEWPVARTH